MDLLFHALNKYSVAVVGAILFYTRPFRDSPVLVVIGAILLPLLALRWLLPYWGLMIFGSAVLVAIAWLTIRFVAACIDHR